MSYQAIIAGTVGRENTYGTIVGKINVIIEGVNLDKPSFDVLTKKLPEVAI